MGGGGINAPTPPTNDDYWWRHKCPTPPTNDDYWWRHKCSIGGGIQAYNIFESTPNVRFKAAVGGGVSRNE
jgi:hypothetical protein